MRLRDLYTGGLTLRELAAYVKHLPPHESALGRVLLGENADWSPVMHRLTDLADLLVEGHHIAVAAAGGKPGKPKRLARPRFATVAEADAHRAELVARRDEIAVRKAAEREQLEIESGG